VIAIVKILFCFSALIFAALVQVPLIAYSPNLHQLGIYNYSPLFITCFLLAMLFKNNYACAGAILFLVAGIIGAPIFAFGGGFQYITEPGFGYILALIPLAFIAFYLRFHAPGFAYKLPDGKSLGPLVGIVAAHLFGLLFLLLTARLNLSNFFSLSLYQFIYDMIFGLAFIAFAPTGE
jgi:biotin transporter BioY